MTTSNNDILEKIHLATDITLGINFTKKIIQVESDNWTVISKRNDLEEKGIDNLGTLKTNLIAERAKEYNKRDGYITSSKKMLTKDENILNRFMKVLETLLQLEPMEQIQYKKLKTEIMKQMIIPTSEFNKILNLAISKDLIEESDKDTGYYRLKKEEEEEDKKNE